MIKMLTAYTSEIDEAEAAVDEILSQLDLDGGLSDNSIGIVSCYSEFVDTGVVGELCSRLPFDVVGETTLGNAVPGSCGLEQLSLSVITSDELSFSTALSEPIGAGNRDNVVEDTYRRACEGLPGDPSLVIAFAPLTDSIGGERILERINDVCGAVPVYGGVSCDHTMTYDESRTIRNGMADRNSMALLLIHGDIKPRFFVASISDSKLQKQRAVITDSDGGTIKTVNGIPFVAYLAERGLTLDGGMDAVASVPFLVGSDDGTQPLARALYRVTTEGYGVFGCRMPTGATLSMGTIDYSDILETTSELVRSATDAGGINGILMLPCLSRSLMIEPNADHEMKKVMEIIGGRTPCHIAYAGGEMCPVYDEEGRALNRFHNFTYTACVF